MISTERRQHEDRVLGRMIANESTAKNKPCLSPWCFRSCLGNDAVSSLVQVWMKSDRRWRAGRSFRHRAHYLEGHLEETDEEAVGIALFLHRFIIRMSLCFREQQQFITRSPQLRGRWQIRRHLILLWPAQDATIASRQFPPQLRGEQVGYGVLDRIGFIARGANSDPVTTSSPSSSSPFNSSSPLHTGHARISIRSFFKSPLVLGRCSRIPELLQSGVQNVRQAITATPITSRAVGLVRRRATRRSRPPLSSFGCS